MNSPFSALAPLRAQLRKSHSIVRPVSQVNLRIRGDDQEEAFRNARQAVLAWMSNRAGRKLPEAAWRGESFELVEVGAQNTAAVAIDQPLYWTARLDDADKDVPMRVWTTEIAIAAGTKGDVVFGARLINVTRGDDTPFTSTVPGFIRQVVDQGNAHLDGRLIEASPWLIAEREDVHRLVALLFSPNRTRDVIVLALPEGSADPRQTAIPAEVFTRRTLGAAHVAVITSEMSFLLTDIVGKEFSVFHQGIRTYRPRFDPEEQEPFYHPLAVPQRIASFGERGATSYLDFLAAQVLGNSVKGPDAEAQLPSFATVRRESTRMRIEAARAQGQSDTDLLALADEEIDKLRKALDDQKQTTDGLLKAADEETERLNTELQREQAQVNHLRQRVDALNAKLQHVGARAANQLVIPDSLDDFEEWCATELSGSVVVLNRAYRGVKKSDYEDTGLIYQAMLLLRDFYVPMRRSGGVDTRRGFEARCRALGLEFGPSFAGAGHGEHGDEYVVDYRTRRRVLDLHLKKGNSRETRLAFRLYFFWDDEEKQAVVGWLPSHLTTRAT
jgi:hypothetical protein